MKPFRIGAACRLLTAGVSQSATVWNATGASPANWNVATNWTAGVPVAAAPGETKAIDTPLFVGPQLEKVLESMAPGDMVRVSEAQAKALAMVARRAKLRITTRRLSATELGVWRVE
jgi:hypothetical protein